MKLTLVVVALVVGSAVGSDDCSEEYPYAFARGHYCCAYNMEADRRRHYGPPCDGGPIGFDSICCLNDNYEQCLDPPCTDYQGSDMCPEDFPNVYFHGDWCCASDREKVYRPQGAACDGGVIGFDSLCCLNDNNRACEDPPCSNFEAEDDVIEWCQYANSFLYSYSGNAAYSDLASAQAACLERSDCGGITQEPYNSYRYTLRVGPQLQKGASPSGETAWVVCERVCSTNFPFPYLNGEYCCKNNVDCNGGPLETGSSCCFASRYEQCEHPPCVSSLVFDDDDDDSDPDNFGPDTDCTVDYPFPFLNGLHCCRYNLDCRGNSIEEDNDCCYHEEQMDCISPPCSCYLEFDDVDDPYYDDDDD